MQSKSQRAFLTPGTVIYKRASLTILSFFYYSIMQIYDSINPSFFLEKFLDTIKKNSKNSIGQHRSCHASKATYDLEISLVYHSAQVGD